MIAVEKIVARHSARHHDEQSVLHHYTSWDGFEGILRDRAFWLTDLRAASDMNEMQHVDALVVDVASELLKRRRDRPSRMVLGHFLQNYSNLRPRNMYELQVFVVCFCTADEDADMWSSKLYGREHEGVCLSIKVLDNESHPPILLRRSAIHSVAGIYVNYDAEVERGLLADAFRAVLREVRAQRGNAELRRATVGLFQLAAKSSVFMKSPKYANEKEHRVYAVLREPHDVDILDEPRRVVMPARPADKALDLARVTVGSKLGEAGQARAEALLVELGYGQPGHPSMPPVVISART